ncbi:Hypothetical predicted protein [Cloeon dipterum]|uniref:C2H2-type domain-containing protein n=1 Tax=Cloeon dipterum TaxID=197152 RepID=A0A8S1C431_9INSE|nr:Hypothetical predicted protein [Cloeon dipterum]
MMEIDHPPATFTNESVKKEEVEPDGEEERRRGDFCVSMRYMCAYCGTRPGTGAAAGRNAFCFHTCSFSKLLEHMQVAHPDAAFRYMRTVSVRCYHCDRSYQLRDFQLHMQRMHCGQFSAIVSINLCGSCHDHCDDRELMLKHVIDTHRIPRLLAERSIKSWMVCLLCGDRYELNAAAAHDTQVEQHVCSSLLCSLDDMLALPGQHPLLDVHQETPLIDLVEDMSEETTDTKLANSKPIDVDVIMTAETSEPSTSGANQGQEMDAKIYSCGRKECAVVLRSVKELERHLRTHLKETCNTCNIQFDGPIAVQVHRAVYADHNIDVDPMALDFLKANVRVVHTAGRNKRDHSADRVYSKEKRRRSEQTK